MPLEKWQLTLTQDYAYLYMIFECVCVETQTLTHCFHIYKPKQHSFQSHYWISGELQLPYNVPWCLVEFQITLQLLLHLPQTCFHATLIGMGRCTLVPLLFILLVHYLWLVPFCRPGNIGSEKVKDVSKFIITAVSRPGVWNEVSRLHAKRGSPRTQSKSSWFSSHSKSSLWSLLHPTWL